MPPKELIVNTGIKQPTISLAPLHYPWSGEQISQFYHDAAQNSLISRVYLGEIVCAKRRPLIQKYLTTIIGELQAANKEIVISTPVLHNDNDSHQLMLDNIALAQHHQLTVEINDLAGLSHLNGQKFIVGPYINTYNRDTLGVFQRIGAQLLCPPFECNQTVIRDLAQGNLPLEITIFGKIPLSISSRCFIAHHQQLLRDECKLACIKENQELIATSGNTDLFTINGMQVQSAKIYNLINQLPELLAMGINNFRIMPTTGFSLAKISNLITTVLSGQKTPNLDDGQFVNGFYHNCEGYKYVQ